MDNLITIILFVAGISLFFNVFFKKINIDVIIGYIFTGAIVGFLFNFQTEKTETLNIIAELGIAFLMFTIGIEFSVEKLRQIKKEVFVYGGGQVLVTAIVFYAIIRYGFDLRISTSFVIAIGLSLSSTAIVLKLLNEHKLLYRTYGKNALGVLIFQDIIVIPVLLAISILSQINDGGLEHVLSDLIINTVIVFTIFILFERYLAKKFLDIVVSVKSDEIFVAAVLFLVIGSAQLAYSFGFSYSLGAFIAGLTIAKTQYKHQIEADLIPFRDLLLGIFFITVGMQLNLEFIAHNLLTILLMLVLIILIKAILVFLVMSFGYRRQTSLKTAIILAQVGEFSFVIFEVAKFNHLLEESPLTQTIIASIILSMAVTPFIFKNIQAIENLFITKKGRDTEKIPERIRETNHIIICGYGALGKRLAKKLKEKNIRHVILERDHVLVEEGLSVGDNIILGNAAKKKILFRVNIDVAKAVIVAIPQEDKMLRIVDVVRLASPKVRIIAKASSLYQKDLLSSMGSIFIIDELSNTSDAILKVLQTKISD